MVEGDTRCSFLGRQARWKGRRWRISAWLVVVIVAFAAKKPVALWGAFCGEVLVALFVAPLLDAEGSTVPCVRFWWDRAVALVAVVL